jgi:hypothetical protein
LLGFVAVGVLQFLLWPLRSDGLMISRDNMYFSSFIFKIIKHKERPGHVSRAPWKECLLRASILHCAAVLSSLPQGIHFTCGDNEEHQDGRDTKRSTEHGLLVTVR